MTPGSRWLRAPATSGPRRRAGEQALEGKAPDRAPDLGPVRMSGRILAIRSYTTLTGTTPQNTGATMSISGHPLRPVVLSGGAGSRLWPLSRTLSPKQFMPLLGERTMLTETLARLDGLPRLGAPIVVCNAAHRFLAAEQLTEAGWPEAPILLEPVGRNTAPALAMAALEATRSGEDPLLLVLPADHVIGDPVAFREAVERAAVHAAEGWLMTFGVVPSRAETGYGYIERGAPLPGSEAFTVQRFVEKPDALRAADYVASGRHLWNSGMFLFRAKGFLNALDTYAPPILAACRLAHRAATRDGCAVLMDRAALEGCPSNSIDYAVMEKTDQAAVLPLDAAWDDVGSWAALHGLGEADADGNVCVGDVIIQRSRGSYVRATSRLVAVTSARDLIVVETPDSVLVADRNQAQAVKGLVDQLNATDRIEAHGAGERRPWGWFESLAQGDGYLVKHIQVSPGASLSLQSHAHRAEQWVVITGRARVTVDDSVRELTAGDAVSIPLGARHRLENPGDAPLVVVEVQLGETLREDDIVRYDDRYGRSPGR